MAWTLTVGIFFVNLVGLSLLKFFQYKLISEDIGIRIQPKNPLDFVGAFVFSQLFYFLLCKVSKSAVQTHTREPLQKISKQMPVATTLETQPIERVEIPQTERLSGKESVPEPLALSNANTPTPSEARWAAAFAEFDSATRRPGLWAKTFAEANGNEAEAKAAYLRTRAIELEAEEQSKIEQLRLEEEMSNAAHHLQMAQALAHKRETERIAAERAYAALPKGICPNCDAVIPLITQVCPTCTAMFGPKEAWEILPLRNT